MKQETKELITTMLEAIVASLVFVTLFILIVFATPDQLSGEADWNEEAIKRLQMEEGE